MTRALIIGMSAGVMLALPAAAQHDWGARVSGQAIVVGTHVDPVPGGGTLGETRFVQPVVMLDVAAPRSWVMLHGTLDLEGWTMPNGELAPGDWGEGFVDRRHPHTYVHELVASAPDVLRRWSSAPRTTLSFGKGFVPFGSDDPMSRPVERFPVNHHLSQILERVLALVAVGGRRVTLEASLFNGDEPEHPSQGPNFARFGDSWSARLSVLPADWIEAQVSTADVHSPENRAGAGPDAVKWSCSVRMDRALGTARLYALLEWARTSEADGAFVFHTVLGETSVTVGPHQPYYRFEATERPEETRTADPFRTVRPQLDNSLLGITRWAVHTIGYAAQLGPPAGALLVQPFAEVSLGHITVLTGIFDPTAFYGRPTFWSASGGVRVAWGMRGHRMGHYGVPMETMMMPMAAR